ncbi:MAG: kpsD [Crocinitomicaceae bacterium]|nr:kpsD [Crocinitomicaceae bacterium]
MGADFIIKMKIKAKNLTKGFFAGLLVLFILSGSVFSQSLTPTYIRNVKVSQLSDSEIRVIKKEMDKNNMSMATLENLAITNGMSPSDFVTLKTRIEALAPEVNESNVEQGTIVAERVIEFDDNAIKGSQLFGSEIFTNASLSFEPNSSMATPSNYILGAGDELQIVIYGIQEYAGSATVTKEGKINIPIVGQVFVNGLTFEAARTQIKKAATRIYGSLASGQSQISITLSKIRTIRVTIIGAKKSGNYSVSSLSTVFNALHIAGGPDINGSYRNIELIRNNKVIRTIDIYKFLTKGDQSDNLNLLENDVIRIPVYESRVKIEGNVKRPGIFEMLPTENFNDLLNYCGGFDEAAYRKIIKLVQNSDNGLKIIDMTEDEYQNYTPKGGDVFKVSQMLSNYDSKVSIKGSVYRPDDYEFEDSLTIRRLIAKAGGLTPDAFLNRALLIRQKDDLTKEVLDVDISALYRGDKTIYLRKNDELYISSIFDLKNQHKVHISGQVKNSGEYPYIENLKLYDLIFLAGGLQDNASRIVEVASIIVKDEKAGDNTKVSNVRVIEIDTLLLDQTKNIALYPYDMVQIRKKPVFERQQFVQVSGEVEYPGNYVIADKKERILDIINRSGSLTYDADKNSIKVVRKVNRIMGDSLVEHLVTIPINYDKLTKNPSSRKNLTLQQGDQIVVGKKVETVKILGNVQLNSEIPFSGRRMKRYIGDVGGFTDKADKKRIYVIYPNGVAGRTTSFLGIKDYPRVRPGSEIIVPTLEEVEKEKLSLIELASIAGIIGSLSGMTVAIINLLSK